MTKARSFYIAWGCFCLILKYLCIFLNQLNALAHHLLYLASGRQISLKVVKPFKSHAFKLGSKSSYRVNVVLVRASC